VFWTFVVGFGLLTEYAIPTFEFVHSLYVWILRRGPAPVVKTAAVCGAIGAILITVGVVQEGRIESLESSAETSLREANATRISELGTTSEQALRNANSASDTATIANKTSKEAEEKATSVDTKLSLAEGRATKLSARLTDASRQVDEANHKADEELKARIKLEAQLINVEVCSSPRVLPIWSAHGKTSSDPLKSLAGTTVVIEFVADNEAHRAVASIAEALTAAKWAVKSFNMVNETDDGVSIQPYFWSIAQRGERIARSGDDAAHALLDFLHSYNWQAKLGPPRDAKGQILRDDSILPPGSIRIQVGLYPAVMYIPPPGAEEFAGALREFHRNSEELTRKGLDSMPPERRKMLEQADKEFNERMRKGDNRCKDFLTWSPN
jgi:hypothetical protein